MNETKSALVTYPAPDGAVGNADFTVRVRTPGGEYQDIFTYLVRVDMHDVREASMATFDFADAAEVEITYKREAIQQVDVRPLSSHIDYDVYSSTILLRLDRPCCLSIEVNGDRFHNLHIFANALEEGAPATESSGTAFIEAGEYEVNKTVRLLLDQCAAKGQAQRVIYFAPGLHRFKDGLFPYTVGHNRVSCGRFRYHRVFGVQPCRECPYSRTRGYILAGHRKNDLLAVG